MHHIFFLMPVGYHYWSFYLLLYFQLAFICFISSWKCPLRIVVDLLHLRPSQFAKINRLEAIMVLWWVSSLLHSFVETIKFLRLQKKCTDLFLLRHVFCFLGPTTRVFRRCFLIFFFNLNLYNSGCLMGIISFILTVFVYYGSITIPSGT